MTLDPDDTCAHSAPPSDAEVLRVTRDLDATRAYTVLMDGERAVVLVGCLSPELLAVMSTCLRYDAQRLRVRKRAGVIMVGGCGRSIAPRTASAEASPRIGAR